MFPPSCVHVTEQFVEIQTRATATHVIVQHRLRHFLDSDFSPSAPSPAPVGERSVYISIYLYYTALLRQLPMAFLIFRVKQGCFLNYTKRGRIVQVSGQGLDAKDSLKCCTWAQSFTGLKSTGRTANRRKPILPKRYPWSQSHWPFRRGDRRGFIYSLNTKSRCSHLFSHLFCDPLGPLCISVTVPGTTDNPLKKPQTPNTNLEL